MPEQFGPNHPHEPHDSDILIYGKDNCSHCKSAVLLCERYGATYKYKKLGVDYDQTKVDELKEKTGHETFPFVFSGFFLGGSAELNKELKG